MSDNDKNNTYFSILLCLFCFLFVGFGIGAAAHNAYIQSLKETECKVLDVQLGKGVCCIRTCDGCTTCQNNYPTCQYLLTNKTAGKCCNGKDCCQSSRKCSKCVTGETVYDCNCRDVCDKYNDNRLCDIGCHTCYKPVATFEFYIHEEQEFNIFRKEKNCSKDELCATAFVKSWPKKSIHKCWYNTNDHKHVVFEKDEQKWVYWVTITFGSVATLILMGWYMHYRSNKPNNTSL